LVALSAFQTITLSADHNSVDAGPALNWHQLYSFLEPYGRIVIGGRLKTIGIAGLTIGGGMSYFAAKYGFGMDNVLAYEIVTANGGVVTATATTNSDLFWAMKGGGSNFGIVTKFTFATYKMPNVSTAIQLFTEDAIPAYISAVTNLANYQDQVDTGAGGIFTITSTPSTDTLNALFLGVQAGSTIKPPVFSNFTTIPSAFSSYNVTTLAYWSSTLDTPFQASRLVD
jgi:FAD/FMN-containing dehydrogenase